MKQFLMVRASDSFIQGTVLQDDPDYGPTIPADIAPAGMSLIAFDGVFTRENRKDSEAAFWRAGLVEWQEMASLDDLREAKKIEINKCRELANTTYFEFQNKQIACDALAWKDILSANCYVALTGQMPEDWPGGWKTVDNSYVAIPDVATWTQFIGAMVSRGTAHFHHAQQLKALLGAAETPEQIAAITWETPIG